MLLIADAGNTKTTWILADHQMILKQITGEGISPYFDNDDHIAVKIQHVLNELPAKQLTEVRYFGTGCLHKAMQQKIEAILFNLIGPKNIVVSDDLTAAAMALFGKEKGLAVISGTGSNAGAYDGVRMVSRIKSLGYLLGDEGSGADIGFRFLKLHLSGSLPAAVADRFREEVKKSDQELLKELYSQQRPQAYVASFIPFIEKNRDIPEINNGVISSFKAMFKVMISPLLEEIPDIPLGFCGSVAKIFEKELRGLAQQYSLKIKTVVQEPALQLAQYLISLPSAQNPDSCR